jgi:phage-related minor tail protein
MKLKQRANQQLLQNGIDFFQQALQLATQTIHSILYRALATSNLNRLSSHRLFPVFVT